ncbi:MAG: alginate O-acetyltransferase AlgF [Marinovum sp.]|nr:alginate O-acetyltransferase AlgF [Marinovum sp.]
MPRNKTLTRSVALLFTLCVPQLAQTDESVLYDAPAPADAVFVRLLDVPKAASSIAFGGRILPLMDALADTYTAISASDLSDVAPGGYYSLVSQGDHMAAIEEPPREAVSKVHLIVVNNSLTTVRLIVPGADMEVVGAVEPGASGSRAVNPVNATLAVERISDGTLLEQFDVSLSRGQNVSFIAFKDTARIVKNTFGPVLTLN